MERKSIINWRDAIKLAVGIAIGLNITVISMLVFAECKSAIDNEVNSSETWQHRLNSSNSKETLVVSGIEGMIIQFGEVIQLVSLRKKKNMVTTITILKKSWFLLFMKMLGDFRKD